MSLDLNNTLSQGLSLLTYNADCLNLPTLKQRNLYMGVGMWSSNSHLSVGVPVDVQRMLLAAKLMREKIVESTGGQSSKVIILMANSMAVKEGADPELVCRLVHTYKKSLIPCIHSLHMEKDCEIVLSSELDDSPEFQQIVADIEENEDYQAFASQDPLHHTYLRTQTAITRYMEEQRQVGIKLGWVTSAKYLRQDPLPSPEALKGWDEFTFDRWHKKLCPSSTIECLYTQAGKKQPMKGPKVEVSNAPPYNAAPNDRRYVLQTQTTLDLNDICPLQKSVATHWKGVAELCAHLIHNGLARSTLLPDGGSKGQDNQTIVHHLLEHWSKLPIPFWNREVEQLVVETNLLPRAIINLTLEYVNGDVLPHFSLV